VNRIPRWRIAAAGVVLAGLVLLLAVFSPYYFRNLQLQSYVSAMTHTAEGPPKSDEEMRGMVLDKARRLNLPIAEDNVHVTHSPDGLHIEVRYAVRVNLPGYTVDLHFYPGAGSR
jgi:hypothetical protein